MTADWHELMLPQRIMPPYTARAIKPWPQLLRYCYDNASHIPLNKY